MPQATALRTAAPNPRLIPLPRLNQLKPATAKKPRILVVEDDLVWTAVVSRTLRDYAGDINSCEQLAEAVRILETQHYDAVLVDLSLRDSPPDCTFQTFDVLTARLPVVVITGSRMCINRYRERLRQIDDFLCKDDLDGDVLKAVLTAAIGKWKMSH